MNGKLMEDEGGWLAFRTDSMRSPFPGVDPFLEDQAYWSDFHAGFLTYWRDAIADRLPENYEARIDERVSLVEAPEMEKLIKPDVAVVRSPMPSASKGVRSTAALLEPVTIPLVIDLEEHLERYIKILKRPDRSLVAVLELLSPSNKVEPGFSDYLTKRKALLRRDVHLVELDFLLRGRRLPFEKPLPAGDYYAFVARADRRPDCDVYAWQLPQALPTIPIPLAAPDPDVLIPLAEVFDTAYERGRYRRSVNYSAELSVPLDEEAREWAKEQTKQAAAIQR